MEKKSRITDLAEQLQKTSNPKEALEIAKQIRELATKEEKRSEPAKEAEKTEKTDPRNDSR